MSQDILKCTITNITTFTHVAAQHTEIRMTYCIYFSHTKYSTMTKTNVERSMKMYLDEGESSHRPDVVIEADF